MEKSQNNIVNLDWDFFESIITYNALTDETYLASIVDIVKPNFFKSDDIRTVFNIISEFYMKRETVPTTTELKTHLVTDDQKKAFKNVVSSFKQLDTNYNNDELYENTEQFFKERAVHNAVLKTVNDYSDNESGVNSAETLQLFEDACSLSIVDNLGRDYFRDVETHVRDLTVSEKYISTGYKWLDDRMGGGFLEQGRALYIFCGTTNSGKSIMLGNVAANLIAQDKTVIIISLEMSEAIYSKRIHSQLSKIPLSELKCEVDSLKNFISRYRTQHPQSKLFIKEYPPKDITVTGIKAYVKKLCVKKKIKPDAIIIDYVNLIQPPVITGNSYTDVKYISEKMRALSYTFECPVISATQLNRSAYDEINPGLETTSESMGLTHTADWQASLWSNEQDKELGIIHVGLQKNRFGPNYGSIAFGIDYDTLSISEKEADYVETTSVSDAEELLGKLNI